MKKHATSHGLAVLVCTIVSGVLVKVARDYYPHAVEVVETRISGFVCKLGWDISSNDLTSLLVAFVLAFLWGVAFYFMHSDE